jgi:hypothetical protein
MLDIRFLSLPRGENTMLLLATTTFLQFRSFRNNDVALAEKEATNNISETPNVLFDERTTGSSF